MKGVCRGGKTFPGVFKQRIVAGEEYFGHKIGEGKTSIEKKGHSQRQRGTSDARGAQQVRVGSGRRRQRSGIGRKGGS